MYLIYTTTNTHHDYDLQYRGGNTVRLRRRKGSPEDNAAFYEKWVIMNPQQYKGRWGELFNNNNPIFVELGMGQGQFISQMSRLYPQYNFVGIDKYDELLWRAGHKVQSFDEHTNNSSMTNVKLALCDIEHIEAVFEENEIETIYLNFSDPWPKKRHARRRLTHPSFLNKYMHMLNNRGTIHLKTDSKTLFEFSLNTFANLGLQMRNICLDLHANGVNKQYVMTEYEEKFVDQHMPIYRTEVLIGKQLLDACSDEGATQNKELLNST